jgi:hypothetical protein
MHVHHDASGMTVPQVAQVMGHYTVFQNVIAKLFIDSRYDNMYARPMHNPAQRVARVLAYDDLRAVAYGSERYDAVNLCALRDHGTIEFRQHTATLDPVKAIRWAELTKLIMVAGKTRDYTEAQSALTVEGESLATMARYLKAGETLTEWLQKRAQDVSLGRDPEDYDAGAESHEEDEEPYCGNCDDYGHYSEDCTYCHECGSYDCDEQRIMRLV